MPNPTILGPFREPSTMQRPERLELSKHQIDEMRQWRKDHGHAVKQQTVRLMTTKDKPGTLPLNFYMEKKEEAKQINFETQVSV